MAEPRSCGSINAEIARIKRLKRKGKRAKRSAVYERSRAHGIPPPQAIAKALANKDDSLPNPASDAFLASYEWRRVRMTALKRHGARCQCCGAIPTNGITINVDHIKPRKLYPHLALDPNNLQILCNVCNHGKGNWDMTDWRTRLAKEPESR
jgi:5-methylcytosine-specific restriction endonuclease McrA